MAGNIKGITIEFRGDTAPLEQALKHVDSSLRSIDKELRQVNNGLKFNPTSITLWQQKQTLLKDKVKETEDRLKALKETQAKLDANQVDKNSKEYRELQREIVTTESKLKNFKGQLKGIGNVKLKALSEELKQIGGKVTDIGKNLTTHVTGPLVALGGASIAAFKTVDEGLDTVTRKTGATGQALDDMHQSVKNLASDIPTDFVTAGNAVGEVATRFQLTGQELEALSGKFIKFAKLNNTDVTSSVDQTQKALSAFGLDASQAGSLLDQLNKVGQDTGADMNTLLQGLIQNATGFQQLGLSAQQSAVLMGQMETSGANSETVMQGLRKALKAAAKDGVPLDQALANLQDTIKNGTGDMDGLTAAYDLFGKSGDQIYNAVKNGSLNFKDLQQTVADAGNSIEDTFNATLSPTDQFSMAMNDLKTAGSELGSTLLTTLSPVIEKISGFIQKITEKWNELSPGTQEMIVKAALVAAALGPVLVVVGTLISSIGAIVGAIGTLGPVLTVLTGPFGLIVAAIAAAIAAMIWLTKNFKKVEAGAKLLWGTITESFNAIKEGITNALKAVLAKIVSIWTSIHNAIAKTVIRIRMAVTNAFNTVKTTVSNIWTAIKNKISTTIQAAKDKVSSVVDGIKTKVSNAFNSVLTTVKNVWNKVKTAISDPINKAKETVQKAIDKIKSIINGAHLKLPKFKLPHFKINGGKLPWGIGGKGSPPSISVDWYAKGGIFDSASLIGVGEKGPEAVVPLDTLWDKLDKIADNNGAPQIVINIQATPGMDVNALAAEVERRLINSTNRRRLAW